MAAFSESKLVIRAKSETKPMLSEISLMAFKVVDTILTLSSLSPSTFLTVSSMRCILLAFSAISLVISSIDAEISSEVERSEEHTSELQSRPHLVCRLLLEKKKKKDD